MEVTLHTQRVAGLRWILEEGFAAFKAALASKPGCVGERVKTCMLEASQIMCNEEWQTFADRNTYLPERKTLPSQTLHFSLHLASPYIYKWKFHTYILRILFALFIFLTLQYSHTVQCGHGMNRLGHEFYDPWHIGSRLWPCVSSLILPLVVAWHVGLFWTHRLGQWWSPASSSSEGWQSWNWFRYSRTLR